jgi:hypothetical protein
VVERKVGEGIYNGFVGLDSSRDFVVGVGIINKVERRGEIKKDNIGKNKADRL